MGMGAKRSGSHDAGGESSALALTSPEIPTQSRVPSPVRPTPVDPGQNQTVSVKWAGRDPKTGKVIPHRRSEKIARVVGEYAASGLDKNQIACLLNIRPGHLEQHYYRELHNGLNKVTAEVASAMINRAKSRSLNPVAQRAGEFVLQARAGWRTGDQKQMTDVPMLNIVIHS